LSYTYRGEKSCSRDDLKFSPKSFGNATFVHTMHVIGRNADTHAKSCSIIAWLLKNSGRNATTKNVGQFLLLWAAI
jgi:hypothetical protein